jgi:hypothetical protein
MAVKNEKDLAVVNRSTGLAGREEIPDFLRSDIGKSTGMENVEQSDILLPRLGLCQALSPQKRKSHSSYIDGLLEGQLFNSVTQEIYGETLDVIPLFFFKNRIKFIPMDAGGGMDCQSQNGIDGGRICPSGCASCQYSIWGNGKALADGEQQDPPACTMYHNYMTFNPNDMTPIAISYKSSGLKLSKQLLAQTRLTRLPMYAKVYKVTVVVQKDGANEWFEKKITPTKFVDQDMYREMERNFQNLKDMNIHVDTTGETEDESFEHGENTSGSTEL